MGGTIYADSEEGEWAKFTVKFPFVDACADVHGISKKLKNATVFHVHTVPEDVARFDAICREYRVKTVNFKSMATMDAFVMKDGTFDHNRSYICLVREDLYRPESYQGLSAAVKKSVLLTFGPKFSVDKADGHYRSYLKIIPSVLMQSLSAYLTSPGSTTGRARLDAETSSGPVSYADLKVLVAEDNLINQKVLVRMLKRLGVTNIDTVNNGQEAVDKEAWERYNLVLMDMQMPVMGGVEACRLIVDDERRNGRPKPKVVFVTAHVENSFVLEAARAGSSGFLSKPFNIKRIEKCFQTLQLGSRLEDNDSF
jgi:CheY-like chemotaxis protein